MTVVSGLASQGVQVAVATSKSVEVAERLLQRLGVRRWFTLVEGTPPIGR